MKSKNKRIQKLFKRGAIVLITLLLIILGAKGITQNVVMINGKITSKNTNDTLVTGNTVEFFIDKESYESQPPAVMVCFNHSEEGERATFIAEIDNKWKYNYTIEAGDNGVINLIIKRLNIIDTETEVIEEKKDTGIIANCPRINFEIYGEDDNTYKRYKAGSKIIIKLSTTGAIDVDNTENPRIKVVFGDGTNDESYISGRYNKGVADFENVTTGESGITTWEYSYVIQDGDNGYIGIRLNENDTIRVIDGNNNPHDIPITDIIQYTNNNTNSNLKPFAVITLPIVEIKAEKVVQNGEEEETLTEISNITNADKIRYTFTWSEEVADFKMDDITVNGGSKGNFKENKDENQKIISYSLDVIPNTVDGNVGNIQVAIEKGAVNDLVGYENVRAEKVIVVDKKAPVLSSLRNITEAKYLKTGDFLTIVATFDEAIKCSKDNDNNDITPTLILKFGDNGINRELTNGTVSGNSIIYKYIIQGKTTSDGTEIPGDNGKLSKVSLNGDIYDVAGNKNEIKNITLNDNIIADTTKPTMELSVDINDNGLTSESETGCYKAGTKLTITATSDEEIYNKDTNNILSKITSDTAVKFKIKLGEGEEKDLSCIKVEYIENKTVFTYEYEIVDGDNGNILLNYGTDEYFDIALNSNDSFSTDLEVIADTKVPSINLLTDINDNNDGTYTANFSEKLYYLDGNIIKELNNDNVEDNGLQLVLGVDTEGIKPTEIDDKKITYTATSGREIRGFTLYNKICDIAGNMFNPDIQTSLILISMDVTAPITSEAEAYGIGTEVEIKAKFNNTITGTAPKLIIKFGEDVNERTVENGVIEGKEITYKYIVQESDNGILKVQRLVGNELKGTDDTTFIAPNEITLDNAITVDGIRPTIESITAYNGNTETEIEDKTNSNQIKYVIKWSEKVNELDINNIDVTNGSKVQLTTNDNKTYELTVDTVNDGIQIVKINSDICKDESGNNNKVGSNKRISTDNTKPTIQVVNNGGKYVVATDTEKSNLKETIICSEELEKLEYCWKKVENENNDPIEEDWIDYTIDEIMTSYINISSEIEEAGEYILYIRATDKAGNIATSKTGKFIVNNSKIKITKDEEVDTKYTITYGEGLIENRKAGIEGKTLSVNPETVIITENGTIYAEATDKFGNKVFNTFEATGLTQKQPDEEQTADKTSPTITFGYTTTSVKVGDKIGATILTDEDAKIEYSWDNKNWESNEIYTRNINVTKTTDKVGSYTLYAKATDKSKNVSDIKTLEFTVIAEDEQLKVPEIIFEDLVTYQSNGIKYVKVLNTMTTEQLTAKMSKVALNNETPKYEKLTSDSKLKTSTEIKLNGERKYVVIVKGDVNCDGNIGFLGDIILANNGRIGKVVLNDMQKLAADVNSNGAIDFLSDIIAINNYVIGKTTSL